MKVIFLKDVPRVGKKYDIKELNDGYAVNFLFPRKLATPATPQAIEEIEKMKKTITIKKEIQDDLLSKHLEEIRNKTVVIKLKADDKGHLFSAINEKILSEELDKQFKINFEEKFIDLEKPVKEIGEFEIPVKIKNKVSSFKLRVEKI